MQIILKYLENVMDLRQEKKVLHKMGDIIAIVFFASLANASDWTEIHYFAVEHEIFLKKYLELPNGIPSHDTIQRVLMRGWKIQRNYSDSGIIEGFKHQRSYHNNRCNVYTEGNCQKYKKKASRLCACTIFGRTQIIQLTNTLHIT